MKKESEFQTKFIAKLRGRFPEADIVKNDPNYLQGFPDWSIFYEEQYAILEIKRSENEPYRPNQKVYLSKFKETSFRRTVFPENENEILEELEKRFAHGI